MGARRLLVVGASPMRATAFAVWRGMGIEVVLVDGWSQGRYEEMASEFHALDPRDGAADLDRLAAIGATCHGVTTLTDDSQVTVATVAERLGLPGTGVEAAAVGRSKARQRAVCAAAGMPVPRWREVKGPDDLATFFADVPGPAVVKPTDSAGGAGALRVETLEEAVAHWPILRSVSPSRTAVVEEYLEAPREVCVDAVVWDGEPLFVSVVDCEHMETLGFLCTAASYSTEQPDEEQATAIIRRIVDAVDLPMGIVHAEFKITDEAWTTVEFGFRPGGAFVPELTVKVSGVDLYEAQALMALGEHPLRPPVPIEAPYAESRYLVGEGVVRRFVPPASILPGFDDVRVVNQQLGPGQRVRVPLSEAGRAGYAFGWGPDRDRLDEQLRAVIALLGKEMGVVVHGNDGPPRGWAA